MNKADKFTSTGIKFWAHPDQMNSYREGGGKSVVSTHISPTGACNLDCSYCSVSKRDTRQHIKLDVIKDYVNKLKSRGLQAVILTGGGEPTSYRHINELVRWLKEQELSVAMITNGTLSRRVEGDVWKAFSWVRVSINEGVEDKINIPVHLLSGECTVGASYVYESPEMIGKAQEVADRIGARYVRVLPDCNSGDANISHSHKNILSQLGIIKDDRFFLQKKFGNTPEYSVCHQSYFRPYLSEVDGGTVFPCDSLVLNESIKHFDKKYALCKPHEILDFMDEKIKFPFDTKEYCSGCVFAGNVNMLGDWKKNGTMPTDLEVRALSEMKHKEFV